MTNTGNGQSLLGGGRGEQRAGSAEQDFFQLSGVELFQKISAKSDGTAPAAGASGVHILGGIVENQGTAVRKFSAQRNAILPGKFQKHFLSQLPEVTGDDQIKILWLRIQILKMGFYGGVGSRG